MAVWLTCCTSAPSPSEERCHLPRCWSHRAAGSPAPPTTPHAVQSIPKIDQFSFLGSSGLSPLRKGQWQVSHYVRLWKPCLLDSWALPPPIRYQLNLNSWTVIGSLFTPSSTLAYFGYSRSVPPKNTWGRAVCRCPLSDMSKCFNVTLWSLSGTSC